MNRVCLPSVTRNKDSYAHSYAMQQRSRIDSQLFNNYEHAQLYQSQIPVQWTEVDIARDVNEGSLGNSPETLCNKYYEWNNHFFSLENNPSWPGESIGSQLETSNPHQSFAVPSATYEYKYIPDCPTVGSIVCADKKQASQLASPSSNIAPPLIPTYHGQFPNNSSPSQSNASVSCPSKETPRRKRPRICHFLLELLANPKQYSSIVEWVDKENGVFKFLNSSEVASQWGMRRDKPHMKYENFARSLRTYIAKGIMTKPRSKLVYRFTEKVL